MFEFPKDKIFLDELEQVQEMSYGWNYFSNWTSKNQLSPQLKYWIL